MEYPRAAPSHAPKSVYASLGEQLGKLLPQRFRHLHGWFLVAGICLVVSIPLYLYGIPFSGDALHHYRMSIGFHEAIADGNYYPSWLASTNGGYGDPSVRFYPPALYYMLSIGRSITGDWYYACLLTFTLLGIVGGMGIYSWTRTMTADRYAVAAALLYSLSAFHAVELYQAAMFAQYAAASVLPFVFAFTERIIKGGSRANVAGLGVSYALLILFHVPLATLGSIAIGIYASIRLLQTFSMRAIYRLVAGVMLGAALSCFYWLPMLRELKWKSPSGAGQGEWFNYKNNFIFQASPNGMNEFVMPMLLGATLAMALPAVILIFRRRSKALACSAVGLATFVMATPASKPVWDALPFLQETQFPWRWLTITSACISVLVAISLPELAGLWRTRRRPLALASAGLIVVSLSVTALQLIRGATFQDHQTLNHTVDSLVGSTTNKDFLPIWAGKPLEMSSPVEAVGESVSVIDWAAERKVFQTGPGHETEVRLKTFYYPDWKARAGDLQLPTRPADEDGALIVTAPPNATIEVRFVEPLSTLLAGVVSVCGLLVAAWLAGLGLFSGRASEPLHGKVVEEDGQGSADSPVLSSAQK